MRLLAAGAAGAAIALVGAQWLFDSARGAAGDSRAALTAERAATQSRDGEAASLRETLEAEMIARETLASEVALMRAVLEALIASRPEPVRSEESADPREQAGTRASAQAARERTGFDVRALEAAGVSETDARALREVWEEAELAKLDLIDEATRGGWLFSPRHQNQIALLQHAVREKLGEEDTDRMLYATGQPNRVEVRDVLSHSAAADAGIQKGDSILRYDGARIFSPIELRSATAEGRRGETVRVVLDRGGQVISTTLPRGPMGILLKPAKAAPPLP